MAAAPLARHLDRGVSALGSVEHLDDLGKLEEAHWEGDLLARDTDRDALAVPSGEELLQRVAYIVAEANSLGHARRTCSIGWPKPRPMARENAATNSASRRPESRSLTAAGERRSLRGFWGSTKWPRFPNSLTSM